MLAQYFMGILTDDFEKSTAFYIEKMGLQIIAEAPSHYAKASVLLGDLTSPAPLLIRLAGGPFTGPLKEDFEKYGPGIDTLGFLTDDVAAFRAILSEQNPNIAIAEETEFGTSGISFREPDGLHLQVYDRAEANIENQFRVRGEGEAQSPYAISHICYTTKSTSATEEFFMGSMGLLKLYEVPEEGVSFLGAPANASEPEKGLCPLELVGPPGLWPLDREFMSRHGPGMQFLCFNTDNVDGAHRNLVAKGVECTMEPKEYAGNRIVFFRDPNGIDLEICLPLGAKF